MSFANGASSRMAKWRQMVLTLFPDMRLEVQRRDYSVHLVFFDLLQRVREAHQDGDLETLRRIYGFAEWCSEQRAKDLWNSAGVGFYEHLFDSHRSLWPEMVRWLSPRVVDDCMGLWELRLSEADMAEVRRLFAERRKPLHQEARQAMRGI